MKTKPNYWSNMGEEKPIDSIHAYVNRNGFVLCKKFLSPTSIIGVWCVMTPSGAMIGAKGSNHRDIVNPPKLWANKVIEDYSKAHIKNQEESETNINNQNDANNNKIQ
jgi:hypothetical protein